MRPHFAILSWGSLLWERHPTFDKHHRGWRPGGPILPIEFSQVDDPESGGGLTLVIDPENGWPCEVHHAISVRKHLAQAVQDLKRLEQVPVDEIGFVSRVSRRARGRHPEIVEIIERWAERMHLAGVVWTDSPSNFRERLRQRFSVPAAIAHIRRLSPEGKAKIAQYVWRAPDTIDTALRRALQQPPWFFKTR